MLTTENKIELDLIAKLQDLKNSYCLPTQTSITTQQNFRENIESLNNINLKITKFIRLHDTIVTVEVFKTSQNLLISEA